MSVLQPKIETEIRNSLNEVYMSDESGYTKMNSFELSKQDVELEYEFTYYNYHQMNKVKHGIEIVFRLKNAEYLVNSDITAFENCFDTILKSRLTYNDKFKFNIEENNYVFIEEIIHYFDESP